MENTALERATAEAEASSKIVRNILIVGPVLVVIIGVIILTLIANRLGQRISLVAKAAQDLSEGNLNQSYQLPGGHDEVGTLSTAFSHMAGTIRTQLTQQKKAEEDLRENEKIYRLMAENATDMIARLSVDGIYLYASPACHTVMGYDAEELIGTTANSYIHPDDFFMLTASAPILDGLDSTPVEYRVRHKNRTYVWVECISRAVFDLDTGMLLEIHATTRDITERKRAVADLRARDELFQSAFHDATIGMALVSLDGKWLRVQPSTLRNRRLQRSGTPTN